MRSLKKTDDCAKLRRKYRIITDNAVEVIWVYNINSNCFTYASPSTFKLRGFSVAETLNQSLKQFMPPESLKRADKTTNLLIKRFEAGERTEEQLSKSGDFTIFCKNGSLKEVEVIVKLHVDQVTGDYEIIGVSRDITERKHLEAKLKEAIESKNEVIKRLEHSEHSLKLMTQELNEKNRTLHDLAELDVMTGIYNRYSFNDKIAKEVETSIKKGIKLSILLFDIDDFKHINDKFGHQMGDDVLIKITATAGKYIRKKDVFARWGGEEFVLLMPDTNIDQAIAIAERIRRAVAGIRYHEFDAPVTISVGVTEFVPGEKIENCFQRVDQAMYASKHSGKNCVTPLIRSDATPLAKIELGWSHEWESGNSTIDSQHIMMLYTANELLAASLVDSRNEETRSALQTLMTDITEHFKAEEQILETVGYPGLDKHRAIHRELIERLNELDLLYHKGKLRSSTILSFMLDEVIMGHLLEEDVLYFSWLSDH